MTIFNNKQSILALATKKSIGDKQIKAKNRRHYEINHKLRYCAIKKNNNKLINL